MLQRLWHDPVRRSPIGADSGAAGDRGGAPDILKDFQQPIAGGILGEPGNLEHQPRLRGALAQSWVGEAAPTLDPEAVSLGRPLNEVIDQVTRHARGLYDLDGPESPRLTDGLHHAAQRASGVRRVYHNPNVG